MRMLITLVAAITAVVGSALLVGTASIGTVALANDSGNDNNVALLDNCDPADPAWTPTGGCLLKPKDGDVSFAEFSAFLFTPLSPPGDLIGHPAWRIQPSYLSTEEKRIRVRNNGGRTHTFTEVANYGGGFVPTLNGDLAPALECLASPPTLAPGASTQLSNLGPGLHKFQCCIHPWMRATFRVQ
jgi:hypothetical protein